MEQQIINIPSMEILTERPKNMSYETYREKRKHLSKMLKNRLKRGFLVFKSVELILDSKGDVTGKKTFDSYSRTKYGELPILKLS